MTKLTIGNTTYTIRTATVGRAFGTVATATARGQAKLTSDVRPYGFVAAARENVLRQIEKRHGLERYSLEVV